VSYYEVLLFVHVLGVAIWLGTGFALLVLGDRFGRAGTTRRCSRCSASPNGLRRASSSLSR